MKKIKRALATVLCCAMIFGVCVPFASAESEPITEITQEMPEQVVEEEKNTQTNWKKSSMKVSSISKGAD